MDVGRFLVFSASLRAASLNTKLAALARAVIERRGGIVDAGVMTEFDCPSYNWDEQLKAFPPEALELRSRIAANDALVVASPEYNASMPGVLKNAIDWVSRFRPHPFNTKHALLLSASPSMVGGNRGLWALRVPLEELGVRVYPEMFSLAQADRAFAADGTLANQELAKRLEETITGFMNLVDAATHYPGAKKALLERETARRG